MKNLSRRLSKVYYTVTAVFVSLSFFTCVAIAVTSELDDILDEVEKEWSVIYYSDEYPDREDAYEALLEKIRSLESSYPKNTELVTWEAIVLCTYAGEKRNLSSLFMIADARDLLLAVIKRDPDNVTASAYVTLGNLYYKTPGWPISFGDDEKGRLYLEKAFSMKPNAIDTNFFYGDFLVDQGEKKEGIRLLWKALNTPTRPQQELADTKMKENIRKALEEAGAQDSK